MIRWTPLALLAFAAGCSGDEATPVAFLFDRIEAVDYQPSAAIRAREPLEALGAWQPVVRVATPPSAEELAEFLAESHATDDEVVFGTVPGNWVRTFAVEPEDGLLLQGSARVLGQPQVPGTVLASVLVFEFASVADAADVTRLRELQLGTTEERLRAPETEFEFSLQLSVGPATRALTVVLSRPGSPPTGPAATEGVTFSGVELFRPGFADLLDAVAEDGAPFDPRGGLPFGSFRIAMVHRPALALAPGSSASFPLEGPAGPARVEAVVGLAPHQLARPGAQVRFVCEALDARRVTRARWEHVVAARATADARWESVTAELPEELYGEPMFVRVRAESESRAEQCVPLLARPRVVPHAPRRRGPNVVIVSIDTLRADHVGAYGYGRGTTPRLDELAAEALVFTDTWAQCSYTLASHMSLFSGQFPSVHGVENPADAFDPERTQLLAELLRSHGYATAAFTAGGFVLPTFGFGRGFESYSTIDPVLNPESERLRTFVGALPAISLDLVAEVSPDSVAAWIERHRAESFLLFFHTYAPHDFDPPEAHRRALGIEGPGLSADERSQSWIGLPRNRPPRPMQASDRERLTDLYDAAIHAADAAVGRVLDALRENGLWEDTVLVVTSDHGKEIGDRGDAGHGHSLYDELLRVPLIVRLPGVPAARIDTPAMLVDVLPTVLEALALDVPRAVQGHSLLSLPEQRMLFAEIDYDARKTALRDGGLKTIYSPLDAAVAMPNEVEEETYDLDADPGEREPLPSDPERLRHLIEFRDALRALGRAIAGSGGKAPVLSEEAQQQLEALGYAEY